MALATKTETQIYGTERNPLFFGQLTFDKERMNIQWEKVSSTNDVGILIGIALDVSIALGRIDVLPIFVFPIHEHGIYFHFLVFIFFHQYFKVFSVYIFSLFV